MQDSWLEKLLGGNIPNICVLFYCLTLLPSGIRFIGKPGVFDIRIGGL